MLRGVMRGTIVALLLTACTTAMHFRVIDKGAHGAEASKPSVTVTKGRDESVIGLEVVAPPAGGIVTMALPAPYAVIAVDADVKAVRWVDENGTLIAESK